MKYIGYIFGICLVYLAAYRYGLPHRMKAFDYIIVGAGSAGCVLADKLSADGRHSVLLLESGPQDNRFWLRVPIGYGMSFYDRNVNWQFFTLPEPGLDGRKIYWPRGRVLGGSSSINALVYHRGIAADYDDWAAAGNPGWDYKSVEAVFESFEQMVKSDDKVKNASGKLTISDPSSSLHPMKDDFFAMSAESQIEWQHKPLPVGEGISAYLITTRNGRRCSSAVAFLHPVQKRKNLTVITDIDAERILLQGKRARSVLCTYRGTQMTFSANREIILSAGAVKSPQLLQVSGIGPGKVLRDAGVTVKIEHPHVGMNMQDHLGVNYFLRANKPTMNNVLGSWPGRIRAGIEYVLRNTGPFALSVNQIGGLVKTDPNLAVADTQIYANPVSYQIKYDGERPLLKPDMFPGFIIGFNSCRPASEGKITIASERISVAPQILGNYMTHQKDIDDVVRMARFVGKLQNTPAIQQILSAPPETPLDVMGDADIIADFRQRCGTIFHPSCTCRMGTDIKNSVVNSYLKVHAVGGLRVVDTSVFPNITSANTNAPTIMVAHKAAMAILDDAKGPVK